MTGHAVDANDTSSDLMLSFFMSDILDIYIPDTCMHKEFNTRSSELRLSSLLSGCKVL